jgi:hypothetical protein
MKLTAYHKYLWNLCEGDLQILASLIFKDIVSDQNPQAFDLLAATGDKMYTPETFYRAANLIKEAIKVSV